MLSIVGLSHVITKSAARVQVSFQQIQLRLYSKCYLLFTRYSGYILHVRWIHLWRFFGILQYAPQITKISLFFTELFHFKIKVLTLCLKHGVERQSCYRASSLHYSQSQSHRLTDRRKRVLKFFTLWRKWNAVPTWWHCWALAGSSNVAIRT